jgi:hypothetical protein
LDKKAGIISTGKEDMPQKDEEIALHSRMKLLKSSIAFKYFLFEDRIKQELGIYTLEEKDAGEWVFRF